MIGRIVSHYEILAKIGEGGMGVVYKARDLRLDRFVALKFLPPALSSGAGRIRIVREAKAAAALEHSNICAVYDIEDTEDQTFIVMAYVEGQSLRDRIAQGPLELAEAVAIAGQIAEGLGEAHGQGILHRDIKAANILLSHRNQARITDFGLASLPNATRITREGTTVGTVSTMSPEQTLGQDLDPRTDLWSLGVVLYEMLTGQLPFAGDSEVAVVHAIRTREPTPVKDLRPEAPEELSWIVQKALAKDRGNRYQSAQEMRGDLQVLARHLDPDDDSQPPTWFGDLNRRRWPLRAAFLLMVALAAILVWRGQQGRRRAAPVLGQPSQVTRNDGWEGDPSLSPDGGRIAYAAERFGNLDIYLVDIHGGSPMRLTDDPASDSEPAWFPDGSSLVFASDRGGTSAIWKVGQLGGGATLLLPAAWHPAVAPDGATVAFSRIGPAGRLRIGLAPLADTGLAHLLTGDGDGQWDHRYPAWSPDGRFLCYAAQDGLYVIPATGGSARRLTSEGGGDSHPTWSRNGKSIYFSSYREGTAALWRVQIKGGAPERLTLGTGPESNPSLSRDGTRLAYTTQSDDTDLVLRDRQTGRETPLPNLLDAYMTTISADRRQIVFASAQGGGRSELWIQSLDQGRAVGEARRLTDQPGNASCPTFSPDGTWLAYYRTIAGQRDIWTVTADGGQPVRFTELATVDMHPAWSPDGHLLAFASERLGTSDIWLGPVADGRPAGDPVRLTRGEVGAYFPAWSTDGRMIIFVGHKDDSNEVWTVRADGSEAPRQLTRGADALIVHWDAREGVIWASGGWGDVRPSVRMVPLDGREPTPVEPRITFGLLSTYAPFDLSPDGRFLVYPRVEFSGNIWIVEAENGVF